MLEYISIKNAALIEEAEINFKNGLNILSGETGSGKSMLIDSINFVLGERTGKDFIRKDTDMLRVEALFSMRGDFDTESFSEAGIEVGEDRTILMSRTLNKNGKTVSRINGTAVTLGMVKELSANLIDIHGQHQHQSLLNSAKHIILLDKFCGSELDSKKAELSEILREYKAVVKKYKGLITNKKDRLSRQEQLREDINEIKEANIKEGEEGKLENRLKLLSNAENIMELGSEAYELLYEGSDGDLSAYDKVSKASSLLMRLFQTDPEAEEMAKEAETAAAIIEDLSRELKRYTDRVEADPYELEANEKRLNVIYDIKKRFGPELSDIEEYLQKAEEECYNLENSENIVAELNKDKERLTGKITAVCGEITEIRRQKAQQIEARIEQQLKDLEMKDAVFKISIEPKKAVSSQGRDNVEFLIATNKGEGLKPLAKIASGGEMSRVMLALKTVLSDNDGIETFIFDEIDTGVSGRTAQKVAEKMAAIGSEHQILCITHLSQIASMGDSHFKIEKNVRDGRTVTEVKELERSESIDEIARLIGGVTITHSTMEAAEEMKKLAESRKRELRGEG